MRNGPSIRFMLVVMIKLLHYNVEDCLWYDSQWIYRDDKF